jgi:hypothetical protein
MQGSEQRVRKVARIKDAATNTYWDVIRFPVSMTEFGELKVRPSVVHDPKLMIKHLQDAGAMLPKNEIERKALLNELAQSDTPNHLIYEARVGWIEGGRAYVTPNGVIGKASGKIIGVNRSNVIDDPSGRLSTDGTWMSWRDDVAERARLSSVMMLAICAALAGPLLYVVKRRSFAINIFGPTRVGKSFAILIGASAPGISAMNELITWRLTDANLEQRLPEYNDSLFPIDDVEAMRERLAKAKYLRVRNVAYNVEQGWSMGRHSTFTRAQGAIREYWRCVALTSHEKSISDLAHSANMDRQGGEALRLIDVPALLDGLDHIFDRIPSDLEAGDLQKWKQDMFSAIAFACERNHGAPFERYIEKLIAHRSKIKKLILSDVAHFVSHVIRRSDGNVARDVSEKFGLLYAAGNLGRRCKLLKWTEAELRDAITKCYLGARELLPDEGVILRRGLNALRARLNELPSLANPSNGKTETGRYSQLIGYRSLRANGWYGIIKRDVFNASFSSKHQRDLVLQWLIQKELVTMANATTSKDSARAKLKEQFIWPDGERRRSYEILLPKARSS